MKHDKLFFRHILPHCFDLNKTAAEARLISETVTADRYQQQLY